MVIRVDGRAPDQLRPVEMIPGYTDYPEGSVLIVVGNTRVLCTVTVEDGVPRWMQLQNVPGGWITGEYAMLPRATPRRMPRETNGPGGRTHEIRRLIGRSLHLAVDMRELGARTITVDCDVIQADGGTRTAAITGAYVALALALNHLIQLGTFSPRVLKPPVAAVSVGVVAGEPLLDLCYEEDSRAEVDLNVVMNAEGRYIEVQGTAEGMPFPRTMLDQLLDLAHQGIQSLLAAQQAALRGA